MTNLHLTWTDRQDRYKAEAFVNNIENSTVISNDGLQWHLAGSEALRSRTTSPTIRRRTVGLRFGVNL